jgi:sugar fermentation stimulation protein A
MKYENIKEAVFLSRPNRFIATVLVDGKEETVHVKNTGRCKELLVPNAKVFLEKSQNPERKTKYDLVAVYKGDTLVNIDSQAPNKVFYEWAREYFGKDAFLKPETKYKNSRFDCYIEVDDRKIFAEVKGVTLEENGVASFPDAPTERGIKHIEELCEAASEGYEAYIFFVVQMKGISYFTPNYKTHRAFGEALKTAQKKSVNIVCVDCTVFPDTLLIDDFIEVKLEENI